VLIVEKRLMLVEEIHIRRRSTVEQHETSITLRSERARVERQGPSAAEQSALAAETAR
jgi:stress response protein YsnF